MTRTSLSLFLRYCATPKSQAITIHGHGFDRYAPVVNLLKRTHFASGQLDAFKSYLPLLLKATHDAKLRDDLRAVGEPYISYWEANATRTLLVGQHDARIGPLSMRLGPTIGLVDQKGQRRFLRLWCNQKVPGDLAVNVLWLLMGDVMQREKIRGLPGVWVVRREFVYSAPPALSANFRSEVEGWAWAFEKLLKQ